MTLLCWIDLYCLKHKILLWVSGLMADPAGNTLPLTFGVTFRIVDCWCTLIGHSKKIIKLSATDVFGQNMLPFDCISVFMTHAWDGYFSSRHLTNCIHDTETAQNISSDLESSRTPEWTRQRLLPFLFQFSYPWLYRSWRSHLAIGVWLGNSAVCINYLKIEEASVIIRLYRYRNADCWQLSACFNICLVICLACRCLAFSIDCLRAAWTMRNDFEVDMTWSPWVARSGGYLPVIFP